MIFLYDLYVWVWAADIKIALRSCMQQGCLGSAVFDIGIRFVPEQCLHLTGKHDPQNDTKCTTNYIKISCKP
jgi:hypothetical protein